MRALHGSWLGLVIAVGCGGAAAGPVSGAQDSGGPSADGETADGGGTEAGLDAGSEGAAPGDGGLDRGAQDSPQDSSGAEAAVDAGATDGGIVAMCRLGGTCSQPGELCSMVGCMVGQTCVCDQGQWACPECSHVDCPSMEPANGTACGSFGTLCPYPATSDACQCSGNSAGPYSWHCATATFCPLLPPADGSSCSGALGCIYSGETWGIDCTCNGTSWSCSMQWCSAVGGAGCPGVPRGVECFLPNGPNMFEGCTCTGNTSPTWGCTPIDCPAQAPTPGSACPHSEVSCTYGGTTCVCTPGLTWSC